MSSPSSLSTLPTDAEEPRYRLAFDEAMRVLQRQEADLAAVQGRALALLSAGTLATAFLGGIRSLGLFRSVAPPATPGAVITTGLQTWQLVLVLALFGLLAALCLFILWPTGKWVFQLDPGGVVRVLDSPASKQAPLAALYRDFAIRLDGHAAANDARLNLRVQLIRAAIGMLALNVGVLFALVARR